MSREVDELQKIIDTHKNIVFFGGAGVSTESGIPDFRSQDGLYNLQYKYPPEQIISHSFFVRDPKEFYRFYKDKMLILDVEAAGKLLAVVTQNIDGLHQKAGSKKVYELHGSIHRNYCMRCRKFYGPEFIKKSLGVPTCDDCGGTIKPDVVLYEEGLDNDVISGAVRAIARADCLIIGGTSLVVYPAAGLIDYFKGDKLVLVNKSATARDTMADLVIREPIGEVFSQIHV